MNNNEEQFIKNYLNFEEFVYIYVLNRKENFYDDQFVVFSVLLVIIFDLRLMELFDYLN